MATPGASSEELLVRRDLVNQLPALDRSLAATRSRCASASRMCSDERYSYQRFKLTHSVAASVRTCANVVVSPTSSDRISKQHSMRSSVLLSFP